jgi:hypothetical protein
MQQLEGTFLTPKIQGVTLRVLFDFFRVRLTTDA